MNDSLNIEYVYFERNGLADFEDFILPHVYEQLSEHPDFKEEGIFCAGALLNGVPCGAVVSGLYEDEEIFIYSIIVDEELRRNGIGSELIKCLLQKGGDEFDEGYGVNLTSVRVFLHTEYAIEISELEGFEAFLRKNGFRDFEDISKVHMFNLADVNNLGDEAADARAFKDIENIPDGALEDFYRDHGVEPALELSFYTGTDDEPEIMMLVSREGDDLLGLSARVMKGEPDMAAYKRVLARMVNIAMKQNPDYRIMVSEDMTVCAEYWAELASRCGTTFVRREAGMYALIDE